jgi:hypothetical protein
MNKKGLSVEGEVDHKDKQNCDQKNNDKLSRRYIYTRLAMKDVIIRISRNMISRVIMVEGRDDYTQVFDVFFKQLICEYFRLILFRYYSMWMFLVFFFLSVTVHLLAWILRSYYRRRFFDT